MGKDKDYAVPVEMVDVPRVGWRTWDDPGDYPSGAGGGPFASFEYPVVEHPGLLVLDVAHIQEALDDQMGGKLPDGIVMVARSSVDGRSVEFYLTEDDAERRRRARETGAEAWQTTCERRRLLADYRADARLRCGPEAGDAAVQQFMLRRALDRVVEQEQELRRLRIEVDGYRDKERTRESDSERRAQGV